MKSFNPVKETTHLGVLLMLGVVLALLFSAVISYTVVDAATPNLSPESGAVGTSVNVTGKYFPSLTDVTISFEEITLLTKRTDHEGSFNVTITIPSYAVGKRNITFSTNSSGELTTTNVTFELLSVVKAATPTISVSPESGAGGLQWKSPVKTSPRTSISL